MWHLNRLEDNPTFDQTWEADATVCYGHNPGDIQLFHDLFLPADPAGVTHTDTRLPPGAERHDEEEEEKEIKHYFTNQELYTQLKPDGMSSPYIYEHFEWAHCEVNMEYLGIVVWVSLAQLDLVFIHLMGPREP